MNRSSEWLGIRRLNPYAEFAYDGLMLNPLEVLFVKVKDFQMQTDWTSALMAATYDRWQSEVKIPSSCPQMSP
jgi:hypothetical protein